MPPREIDPKTGKPKPELKDAITQTDRSDYQIIKAKMLREKQQMEKKLQEQQNQYINEAPFRRQSINNAIPPTTAQQ